MNARTSLIVNAVVYELAQFRFVNKPVFDSCIAHTCAVNNIQLTEEERAEAETEIRRQLDILFNQCDFVFVREGQDGN